MPELPEVETLCRQLQEILPGGNVRGVDIVDPRLGTAPPLAGRRIVSVRRRGKYIRIEMERGLTAEVHLRMTGRLLWLEDKAPVPRYTRMVISVGNGKLVLIDPRRFATFTVGPADSAPAPLANPLEKFPAARLRAIAGKRRLPVKSFLMDQRLIAGIGNIYACEILYKAAVDPRRPAGSLTAVEWRKMEKAAAVVLSRAVGCRGTSISDWRDLFGKSGTNQHNLAVYAREGETCRRCGGTIERMTMSGRGTWFCPTCQH